MKDTDKTRAEEIQTLAYLKWEAAGKPPGDGSEFWSQAEKEWEGKNLFKKIYSDCGNKCEGGCKSKKEKKQAHPPLPLPAQNLRWTERVMKWWEGLTRRQDT